MKMTHERARELIPLLAIGRLSGEEKEALLEHVEVCEVCGREYVKEMRLAFMFSRLEVRDGKKRRKGLSRLVLPSIALVAAALLLMVFLPQSRGVKAEDTLEILGPSDVWDGEILIRGKGEIHVEVVLDGEEVYSARGRDYVHLRVPVGEGEYFVRMRVRAEGKDTVSEGIAYVCDGCVP